MPHRRPRNKGSFTSHFDELVVQFPDRPYARRPKEPPVKRSAELQAKLDVHALLFERAWRLDQEPYWFDFSRSFEIVVALLICSTSVLQWIRRIPFFATARSSADMKSSVVSTVSAQAP